ncbi:hypothetical protein [Clostridium isatidis]|uniref:hypothetical protein n=1 Tax=Clostridium isatidis TaxID=182773 RepID=UPI003AAC8A26
MRKIIIFLLIGLFTLNSGCSKVNSREIQSINAPSNDSLIIEGNWKIIDINLIDDNIENKSEILALKNETINITNNSIDIANKIYKDTSYKLKLVNASYNVSYEFKLKISDIIKDKEKIEVITIIYQNNIIGEFIIDNDNKGYLYYQGILFYLNKTESEAVEIQVNKESFEKTNEDEVIEPEFILEDYNSPVGVMLVLKKNRELNDKGNYSNESYRTLWISMYNGNIQPVLEKNYIVFPRMNGIWEINNKVLDENGIHYEYFNARKIDGDLYKIDEIYNFESSIYKNITFISNDYISMEVYEGDNFQNKFQRYQTIPIDNINSNEGLKIGDIYSEGEVNQYEIDYKVALTEYLKDKTISAYKIDYSNFKLDRVKGKWVLIGNIKLQNSDSLDYRININPLKKLLNYDTLLISWKELKAQTPFLKDAFTSPNGRIAIVQLEDKLLAYEIKDRTINSTPILTIEIEENEEIIMAEWANGDYVKYWESVFKNLK